MIILVIPSQYPVIGTKLAIGAYSYNDNGRNNSGAVYLYEVNNNLSGTDYHIVFKSKLSANSKHLELDQHLISDYKFGWSVAMSADGSKMIVTTPRDETRVTLGGALFLFEVDWDKLNGAKGITSKIKIDASRANGDLNTMIDRGDEFGSSIAMSADGSRIAVGAKSDDDVNSNSGAVYLFEIDWANIDANSGFTFKSKISQNHTTTDLRSHLGGGDSFGNAVSMSDDGTRIAVGALNYDGKYSNDGAVFLLEIADWNALTTTTGVVNKAKLSSRRTNGNIQYMASYHAVRFGFSISLSGDGNKLASSAINGIGNYKYRYQGEIALYEIDWTNLDANNGVSYKANIYSQTGIIGSNGDYFGSGIAMSSDGSKIVIGSKYSDTELLNSGQTYYMSLDWATMSNGGTAGITVDKLILRSDIFQSMSADSNDNRFGSAVAMSGDNSKIAIGSMGQNNNSGAVFLFDVNWASNNHPANINFITRLSKYRSNGDFNNDMQSGDKFGNAVAFSKDGNKIAIGAIGDDDGATNTGAVYLYQIDWANISNLAGITKTAKLSKSRTDTDSALSTDLEAGDIFGNAIAMSNDGTKLFVGTPYDDDGATRAGAVYLYELDWNNITPTTGITKLIKISMSRTNGNVRTDLESYDFFGTSIAVSGDGTKLAVGTIHDDDRGKNAGAVYLYEIDYATLNASNGLTKKAKLSKSRTNGGFNNDLESYDVFGSSVAFNEHATTLVVGSMRDDASGNDNKGGVYVYYVDWQQLNTTNGIVKLLKLSGSTTEQSFGSRLKDSSLFGHAVALSKDGRKLIVSSSNVSIGDVYLFAMPENLLYDIHYSLNRGTDVSLYASNKIFVNSEINTLADTGTSGKLTMIAGHTILVNESIKVKGGLTLIVNPTDYSQGGMDSSERDSGNARIVTTGSAELNAGDGDLILHTKSGDAGLSSSYNGVGETMIWNLTGRRISVRIDGYSSKSQLEFRQDTKITTTATSGVSFEFIGNILESTNSKNVTLSLGTGSRAVVWLKQNYGSSFNGFTQTLDTHIVDNQQYQI